MQIVSLLKVKPNRFLQLELLLLAGLLVFGMAGCETNDSGKLANAPEPSIPPITVGDTITISLVGPPDPLPLLEKPITDDGTITLPNIDGRVQVAGKTPGQLESEITKLYVPKIYTHLEVTVKTTGDRVYYVRGEVRSPGRLIYGGPISVTKAITSAGDFTDFANHKKVYLIRNGKRYRLDCEKILGNEAPDPTVYPGDQIEVKRSRL